MSAAKAPRRYGFWLGLLVLALATTMAIRSLEPPTPEPIDASPGTFSGLRAAAMLRHLLGDEAPHPVGSKANHAVRDRLIDVLTGMELPTQVQRSVGCSQTFAVCANVENVLAEIPGDSEDSLVLMAHYDSVPHAPGAADDGSGVVTLIESARALALEGPHRNRILLVFTDAEEMGLLGAEAFFAGHPWAADVQAVINVEGSGSGGPSLLLRSSDPGGHLLNAYRATAPEPNAYSYSQEVFARMPNDTDFTVPDRAGIASIDFAFAFEFNHYHTPLDTLANLEIATLQHHGDNVLPLARHLAGMDLRTPKESFSYLTLEQSLWITWPMGWTSALALAGLAGLMVVAWRLRPTLPLPDLLLGMLIATGALLLGTGVCFAGLRVAELITGTTLSFPAYPWPWRLILIAGALLPVSVLAWIAGERVSPWGRFLGTWLVLGSIALVIAVLAPLAANLLIVPVLIAALIALLAAFLLHPFDPRTELAATLLAIVPLAYFLLAIAYAMEETQGFGLAPAIYAFCVLTSLALLLLRAGWQPALGLSAVMILAWAGVAWTPAYSEWRPQHLSFYYVLDQDNDEAWISTINANPLPEAVVEALGGSPEPAPITPWSATSAPSAKVPVAAIARPEVSVTRTGDQVSIMMQSRSTGDFTQLIVPATSAISGLSIAGQPAPLSERNGYLQARFYANGNAPVRFVFTTSSREPIEGYLVDGSHTLPAEVEVISGSRGALAVPRHQGDQRLAFQRIRF